jgi:hypothetical protein
VGVNTGITSNSTVPHPTLPPPGKVDMHSGQVACRTAFTFPYQREATFTYRYQP